jgi:hypothetical protein
MLPIQSKIYLKTVKGQSWDIINNVYEFMKREAERKIIERYIISVHGLFAS